MSPFMRHAALLLVFLAGNCNKVAGFGANKSPLTRSSPSSITSLDAIETADSRTRYSEESRKFRRTVYTHEDWVRHRSPDRFVRNIQSITSSGIYKNVFNEVAATSLVAAIVVGWGCIFGDYQDLAGMSHDGPLKDSIIPVLSLPLAPFTLTSPFLGLLLVFRTNTSYKRWDEARKNWGMNINHTRDLNRMGNAYYDRSAVTEERAQEDLQRLALCTWAFVRSMKRHLSPEWEDEEDFKNELMEKLPKEQAEKILNAAHRPNCALQDLSVAIENLPMHFMRRNEMQKAVTIFEDNLGSSERLLTSPIPLFYTRHAARFLSFWLLLLPIGLWGVFGNSWNHIGTIPVTATLSTALFALEELAAQLEEPFTVLPMQAFCDKIYNWCNEIVSFIPGDNGMPVYLYDNYDEGGSNADVGTVAKAVVPEEDETTELIMSLEENIDKVVGVSDLEAIKPDTAEESIKPWRPEEDSVKKSKRERIRKMFKRM